MELFNKQLQKWGGEFGAEYVKRNPANPNELESLYSARFGVSRRAMNEDFLSEINREAVILEVGCNIGNQLIVLRNMGFRNLFGLDVMEYALDIAKKRPETEGMSFMKGSTFDIPFKDGFFDLVYTSGVLIHISPDDIEKALLEIYRCSRKYIWGFEYYGEGYQEVVYRGESELLWKTDFAGLYMKTCPGLNLIKEKRFVYREDNSLQDQMFLLGK